MIRRRQHGARRVPALVEAKEAILKVDLDNITDWNAYRVLAGLTAAKPAKWSEESRHCLEVVHYLLGLVTEVDELFPTELGNLIAENSFEELGDLMWYMANLQNTLIEAQPEASLTSLYDHLLDPEQPARRLEYTHTGREITQIRIEKEVLTDQAKRALAYGDGSLPANYPSLYLASLRLVQRCFLVAQALGVSDVSEDELRLLMTANISKLKKRYTAGFNPTEAVNRKLGEEAKALKKARQRGDVERIHPVIRVQPNLGADVEAALDRQAGPVAGRGGSCRNGGC